MMQSVGYKVIHYGVQGAETTADEQVDLLTFEELQALSGVKFDEKSQKFIGDIANTGMPHYIEFNKRAKVELGKRLQPHDIICLPFGYAHRAAVDGFSNLKVETGIGYPDSFAPYRIFESYAWLHNQLGAQKQGVMDYWFVVPNYYDVSEWDFCDKPEDYYLYFGRICEIKGLNIIREVAKAMPDKKFIICGQGEPGPYLASNVEYHPPLHGLERSKLVSRARAVIMPTRYLEPFGGVTAEAGICGVPVIGSAMGSFTETIEHGVTGYRCRILGDYIEGLRLSEALDRKVIADTMRAKYDMFNVAKLYDAAFTQISDLWDKGWYTTEARWAK
jgi:glycosyltransferase involved in cell wall biosynthesis